MSGIKAGGGGGGGGGEKNRGTVITSLRSRNALYQQRRRLIGH